MKNKYLFVSILLASMLIFGCVGGDQTQQQTQQQNQTQQQTGNGTQGTGQQGTGTSAPDPLTISTYAAATAAGIPLECTAVVNGETMKYYVKGDNMLMSGTTGGRPLTAVLKDDDVYFKLSSEDKASYTQMGLTCDWFLMKGEDNETSTSGSGTGSGSEMTNVDTTSYTGPNVKWSCQAGMFGDEKFSTPGESCTGEDLLNAMQAQYQ
jgi:hypothetical protein